MAWTAPRTWVVGEVVTASQLNTHLRDNLLAVGLHLIARKTSDQENSTTTLANCTTMTLPLLANEVWQVRFDTYVTGDNAADVTLGFTFPTDGELRMSMVTTYTDNNAYHFNWSGTSSPTNSAMGLYQSGYVHRFPLEGVFINGANAGNLQLQFAQSASHATPTVVKAHSSVWGLKLA